MGGTLLPAHFIPNRIHSSIAEPPGHQHRRSTRYDVEQLNSRKGIVHCTRELDFARTSWRRTNSYRRIHEHIRSQSKSPG
jgi:hypothetical protein